MSAATILIADDDRAIRTVLRQALGREGHEVRTTGTAAGLWRWIEAGEGDLVITDVVMPDGDGLDLIPRIRKLRPNLRVIVMSAQNTLLTALKATERGAFEYLPKPFDLRELATVVERALSTPRAGVAADAAADAAPGEEQLPLIGRSAAMQDVYRTLARLMGTRDIQPIFILPEGATKTSGRSAQKLNIEAAKLVADQVRTTLGPKGMDKMLVDNMGNVTITNDGVTILNEMNIEHPSAKMIVEIAKTQETEVGDGTTTAVVLAGELLKNAQDLLDQNVHPTIICKGYRLAADQSQKILEDISEPVTIHDKELLKSLAMTAMTGKSADVAKEYLAALVVPNGCSAPAHSPSSRMT